MKNQMIFIFCSFCIINYCCTQKKKEDTTRISVNVYAAQGGTLYLRKVAYAGEPKQQPDTSVIKSVKDTIIFFVPKDDTRLYEISVKDRPTKFDFIADSREIHIQGNNITGAYTITGSPASISLKKFSDEQGPLKMHINSIFEKLDSLQRQKAFSKKRIDSLQREFNRNLILFNEQNIAYADTVKNPAAFLWVYNNIDFGEDHNRAKQFILKAAQRFPDFQPVQSLKKDILAMVEIYEKEYNVGDTLPSITLPDLNGNPFSTRSLKGKYYLIDFWATWCSRCYAINKYKKAAKEKFPSQKFEVVSVALDDKKTAWQNIVLRNNYNWVQLIDEKMWQGPTARTLVFDSIPFNFLVSPQGVVLAKAIKPDSLLSVLQRTIK
jgi:thiol-disulfide isomerase/thioredoxin